MTATDLRTPGASPDDEPDRLEVLTATVEWMAEELREQRALREQMSELVAELSLVAGPALGSLTERLSEAEAKGWFAFARQGGAIADHVVTSFTEEDVRALGDNIVVILETVREMTQPEVMGLLRRTAVTAQHTDETFADPPGTLALLRQLRDPDVRRGLARTLSVLRTVGAENGPTTQSPAAQPAEPTEG